MEDRKSLSIAFLAISDQYTTLIFFSQNGCQRPFWMTENHFRSHFAPFQINTQLLFLFIKWLPAAILDDRKITFDRISRHFRSIHNFDFFFTKWLPFWMSENRFRSHFSPYLFFKMAAGGHFGSPIWAILDDRKSLSIAFFAISDQYTTFLLFWFLNGRRRPFWKSDLRQKQ